MRCQNVKICNIVKIDDSAITDLLSQILGALQGELTVNPSDAWEAVFQNAVETALANVDIGLDAETLEALETITVTVDTTAGPVEITGEVTLAEGQVIDVNITDQPLDVNITNFAELLAGTLPVTLAGEIVNVSLSAEQIEALADVDDTDDDKRPVSINCFNWESDDTKGTFIGWANANEDGTFGGYTVISGEAPPDGANVTCDEMSVTSIQGIKLEPVCINSAAGTVWAYPVSMVDTATGNVTVTTFLDEMGVKLDGELTRADDCDCPQAKCCEEEDEDVPQQTSTVTWNHNADGGTANTAQIEGACIAKAADIAFGSGLTYPGEGWDNPSTFEWAVSGADTETREDAVAAEDYVDFVFATAVDGTLTEFYQGLEPQRNATGAGSYNYSIVISDDNFATDGDVLVDTGFMPDPQDGGDNGPNTRVNNTEVFDYALLANTTYTVRYYIWSPKASGPDGSARFPNSDNPLPAGSASIDDVRLTVECDT